MRKRERRDIWAAVVGLFVSSSFTRSRVSRDLNASSQMQASHCPASDVWWKSRRFLSASSLDEDNSGDDAVQQGISKPDRILPACVMVGGSSDVRSISGSLIPGVADRGLAGDGNTGLSSRGCGCGRHRSIAGIFGMAVLSAAPASCHLLHFHTKWCVDAARRVDPFPKQVAF